MKIKINFSFKSQPIKANKINTIGESQNKTRADLPAVVGKKSGINK